MADEMTHEAYARKYVLRRINLIATELRDIADKVDREAAEVERVGSQGVKSSAQVAANVQRLVINGLPHLGLSMLTTEAQDADYGRLEGSDG